MNASAPPFDSATHKVVEALLPWFVNGTLDEDERQLVERHLGDCAECAAEVNWLRDLHAACIAGSAQPGASAIFAGLRRNLTAPRPPRGRWASRTRRVVPWAAAAAVVLAVAGAWQWSDERATAFRTLGASDTTVRASQPRLVVVFNPATSEADVRRILRSAQARIVDGPTAANGYVLEAAGADSAQALTTLRGERAVLLAEPLGAAQRR